MKAPPIEDNLFERHESTASETSESLSEELPLTPLPSPTPNGSNQVQPKPG